MAKAARGTILVFYFWASELVTQMLSRLVTGARVIWGVCEILRNGNIRRNVYVDIS